MLTNPHNRLYLAHTERLSASKQGAKGNAQCCWSPHNPAVAENWRTLLPRDGLNHATFGWPLLLVLRWWLKRSTWTIGRMWHWLAAIEAHKHHAPYTARVNTERAGENPALLALVPLRIWLREQLVLWALRVVKELSGSFLLNRFGPFIHKDDPISDLSRRKPISCVHATAWFNTSSASFDHRIEGTFLKSSQESGQDVASSNSMMRGRMHKLLQMATRLLLAADS